MNMGWFTDWLTGENKSILVRVPTNLVAAMDTLVYLNQDEELTKDEIVTEALDQYLKKRLWSAKAKTEYTTEVKKAETFRSSGMAQRRAE
jgi:hypothetical protein